jgi:hypothetical protein
MCPNRTENQNQKQTSQSRSQQSAQTVENHTIF